MLIASLTRAQGDQLADGNSVTSKWVSADWNCTSLGSRVYRVISPQGLQGLLAKQNLGLILVRVTVHAAALKRLREIKWPDPLLKLTT